MHRVASRGGIAGREQQMRVAPSTGVHDCACIRFACYRPSIRAFGLMLFLFLLTAGSTADAFQRHSGSAQDHKVSIEFSAMSSCLGTPAPFLALLPFAIEPPSPICIFCFPDPRFMPPPIVSFEGLSRDESCRDPVREKNMNDVASWPSDDSGAVGPNHYVQVVNLALAIYDKAGNLIHGPVSTCTFWSALAGDCNAVGKDTDQVVLYDRHADRWVVSRPHDGLLYLAVSQTADPAGAYDQYSFLINSDDFSSGVLGVKFSTLFNDYPKLGIWRDAYYVTARPRGCRFDGEICEQALTGIGNTVTAIDRDELLCTGQFCLALPDYVTFFVPDPGMKSIQHSHMLPADVDGAALPPSGAPEYVVQVRDQNLGFPAPGRLQMYEFHVDWTSPASSTLTPTTSLTPSFFDSADCPQIKQPKTSQTLDPLCDGTMMYRLSYRNRGDHEMLLFNHTILNPNLQVPRNTGIRWYELRRPILQFFQPIRTPWVIYQEETYAPDKSDRWLGSVAMDDAGNIALGFDVSSATVFPSIHYVGRRVSDPRGQLRVRETSLVEGGGSQRGLLPGKDQFGDYSQMTVDPTDDCTFWYTNTYYPVTTTPDNWHTRIGAFRFPSCIQFFTIVRNLVINGGEFTLAAQFILKPAAKAISPLTEDVSLQVGPFTVTIPAGSFTQQPDGVFTFEGVIGTVRFVAKITPTGSDSFELEARGAGAATLPETNPVTVSLAIGTNGGTTTVDCSSGICREPPQRLTGREND